jgi:hypothetical protein
MSIAFKYYSEYCIGRKRKTKTKTTGKTATAASQLNA